MRLQVKGKNVEVTPSIREYAERKLAKLEKQLAEPTQVEVELSEQKNPSIADEPRRRGDDLHEGPDAARPRGVARHEGVDRPARRQARAPGQALPRAADRRATPAHRAPRRRRSLSATRSAARSRCTPAGRAGRARRRLDPAARHRRTGWPPSRPAGTASRAASHGIHGVPRRAAGTPSSTAEAPGARRATRVHFVALADGTLVVDEDEPDDGARRRSPTPSSGARRRRTAPRPSARTRRLWAVAARADRASSRCPGLAGRRGRARRDAGATARCDVDGQAVARHARRRSSAAGEATWARVRRPGPPARRRRSGRSRRGSRGRAVATRRRRAGYPVADAALGILREGPSLRRGAAHEAPRRAGRVHRDARARLPGALRRRAAREDGRVPRAARERRGRSRTCSSRRTPRCARRASASPTSASSTSR